MSSETLLSVKHLSAHYGKVAALSPLDLRVDRGQIVTVIGANGAGKSTLLNAIMGALPQRGHSQGAILFQGQNIQGWDIERRVEQGLSLVPERRELFASMSVRDNLLLGGFRLYRAGVRGWRDTLDQVYTLFPRLRERAAQIAGTLSGGERQMLAVGRALMARPSLLMLDEPSLGLAPRVVREIFLIGTEPFYERAAMGMQKYETIVECPDEAAFLAATAGRPLIGVERDHAQTTIWEAPAPAGLVYLFGSENDGLPGVLLSACSTIVAIPMYGINHSYPVAIAAGMVLCEWARRNDPRGQGQGQGPT